ncbi:hypothetical protein VHEMI05764 [[Torrubiella] hemipterigena]|uniref:Stress response RCI peptide n=1 Tax=[Torrubiella] hemipterigena TaxID=1531966 RepID=A0A0A1THG0_9HYPO|nr:hypothetical protein VHEMI05764 [[Torrubiella] hemipterigena]
MCSADIFLGVLAMLFPPLPVWVKCGICSADSLINILLCLLGFIPGLLHAWYIIAKNPEPAYEYETVSQDNENGRRGGRVTYVYVQQPCNHEEQPRGGANGGMNYGTTNSEQQPGQSSSAVPPSYSEVVSQGLTPEQRAPGDNKVQRP